MDTRRLQQARSVRAALWHTVVRNAGLLRLVVVLTLLPLNGCAWLDAQQRQIIYRPTLGAPANFANLRVGDKRYVVDVPQTTGQYLELWWLPHSNTDAPTLLYFHGTFLSLFDNLPKIEALREAGFSVLAVDYRGWGMSTPLIPSEQTILQDADVAWTELQRHEPRAAQRVIYGHSMGSGVAVDLASRLQARTDYGALILESAFTSFTDLARQTGWVTRFLALFNRERFDSLEKIARVHVPVLMIHGRQDTTVPLNQGEKLFAAANPPKQWLTIEAGAHTDLAQVGQSQYQTAVQRFICDHLSSQRCVKR